MKIGINASFARKQDSGTGQVTVNFLRKLAELERSKTPSGNEFVLYLEEDLPKDFVLPKNFQKSIFLPAYKRDDLIRKIWWEKFLLPKKVRKDGCDVFLSLYQSASVLKKTKHIMFVHDAIWKIFPAYLNNWRKKIYYRFVDKAIVSADKIAVNSENSKRDICELFGVSNPDVHVCLLDCDPLFKKEYSKEEIEKVLGKYKLLEKKKKASTAGQGDTPSSVNRKLPVARYIFYVGGFDRRKNVRGLLEAYGLLWKRYSKETEIPLLVLAGKFNPSLVPLVTDIPKKIVELKEKYGCPESQIRMIDFVSQEDLPMLYKGAEFFCYPSLYEGFGLPLLEAANCGCAILTAGMSSIPEVINEKGAVFADPRHHESIAIAMYLLLTEDALKQQKIAEANKQAKKFDWGKTVKEIFSIILSNR